MFIRDIRVTETSCGFRASATVESGSDHKLSGELFYELKGVESLPSPEMAATAFLIAALPTAIWLGEDLSTDAPCDAEFMKWVGRISHGFARLHQLPQRIKVSAPSIVSVPKHGRKIAMSFSGGVDSFYTLLANRTAESPTPVSALVTVLGFDTHVDNLQAHQDVIDTVTPVAHEEGLQLITVRTNFRTFFKHHANWAYVTHGSCLFSIAFLLSGEYHTYLVPSSHSIERLIPWASHPLWDGTFRSTHMQVMNDGWEMHRSEKLKALVGFPLALQNIRVCAKGAGAFNCGICEKCIRTKTLFYLNGQIEFFQAEDRRFDARLVSNVRLKMGRTIKWYEELAQMADATPEHRWLSKSIRRAIFRGRLRVIRRRLRGVTA